MWQLDVAVGTTESGTHLAVDGHSAEGAGAEGPGLGRGGQPGGGWPGAGGGHTPQTH